MEGRKSRIAGMFLKLDRLRGEIDALAKPRATRGTADGPIAIPPASLESQTASMRALAEKGQAVYNALRFGAGR